MSDQTNNLVLHVGAAVTPTAVLRKASVNIGGGRIQSVDEGSRTSGTAVLDLSDCVLYPGFIDVHIQSAAGNDTLSANDLDLAHVSSFLASKGVTSWLPTLVPGPAEQYESAAQAVQKLIIQQESGAEPLGARA